MVSTTLRNAVRLSDQRVWQLARSISVHPTVVSKWLSGAQPPRRGDERVIALGAALGVAPDACFAPDSAPVDVSAA
jgi:hypothetical protein